MDYIKVFTDFTDTIGALGDAERGRLFTAMLDYARTGAEPELGGNERYIWGAVKSGIDKQRSAYQRRCVVNQQNAFRRYESQPVAASRSESQQEVSITYIESNSVDSLTKDCNEVIDFLNQVAGTSYKHSDTSRKPIRARLNDGFTVDDCKQVIRNRWKHWKGTEMQQYMRPDTLFRPSKFEAYLNSGDPIRPRDKRNTLLNYKEENVAHVNLENISLSLDEL